MSDDLKMLHKGGINSPKPPDAKPPPPAPPRKPRRSCVEAEVLPNPRPLFEDGWKSEVTVPVGTEEIEGTSKSRRFPLTEKTVTTVCVQIDGAHPELTEPGKRLVISAVEP